MSQSRDEQPGPHAQRHGHADSNQEKPRGNTAPSRLGGRRVCSRRLIADRRPAPSTDLSQLSNLSPAFQTSHLATPTRLAIVVAPGPDAADRGSLWRLHVLLRMPNSHAALPYRSACDLGSARTRASTTTPTYPATASAVCPCAPPAATLQGQDYKREIPETAARAVWRGAA